MDVVYRILDNMDEKEILLSLSNVCTRINNIINSYQRYKVNIQYLLQKENLEGLNSKKCLNIDIGIHNT